jgi:hypothetical protein
VRSTAAPYTESRLTRSVANERVGFPVVEQLLLFQIRPKFAKFPVLFTQKWLLTTVGIRSTYALTRVGWASKWVGRPLATSSFLGLNPGIPQKS